MNGDDFDPFSPQDDVYSNSDRTNVWCKTRVKLSRKLDSYWRDDLSWNTWDSASINFQLICPLCPIREILDQILLIFFVFDKYFIRAIPYGWNSLRHATLLFSYISLARDTSDHKNSCVSLFSVRRQTYSRLLGRHESLHLLILHYCATEFIRSDSNTWVSRICWVILWSEEYTWRGHALLLLLISDFTDIAQVNIVCSV